MDKRCVLGYGWVTVAVVVLLLMLSTTGCRTEYYESGKVKSEGFHLGTTGKGNYSVISFEVSDKEE